MVKPYLSAYEAMIPIPTKTIGQQLPLKMYARH